MALVVLQRRFVCGVDCVALAEAFFVVCFCAYVLCVCAHADLYLRQKRLKFLFNPARNELCFGPVERRVAFVLPAQVISFCLFLL